MGFRGEALAAISSVSMIEMSSSKINENDGHYIEINGGDIISEKELNTNEGTSIKVKNLFFNVPARRNFLKSDFVELKHIINVFNNIAISHNEIEFTFIICCIIKHNIFLLLIFITKSTQWKKDQYI